MFRGISGRWTALHNAPRRGASADSVTAQAIATGQDQLEYTVTEGGGIGQQFAADQRLVRNNRQPPAALIEALQVAVEQHGLPDLDGNGLEQTITVRQATVFQGHCARRLTVDPAFHHSANRRNTREPLVPPKPNELDNTTSIGIFCGS